MWNSFTDKIIVHHKQDDSEQNDLYPVDLPWTAVYSKMATKKLFFCLGANHPIITSLTLEQKFVWNFVRENEASEDD